MTPPVPLAIRALRWLAWVLLDGDGLRAGWRLMAHAALTLGLTLAAALVLVGGLLALDAAGLRPSRAPSWAPLGVQAAAMCGVLLLAHALSAWFLDARFAGPRRGLGRLRGVGLGPPLRGALELLGGLGIGSAALALTIAGMATGGVEVGLGRLDPQGWLAWTVVLVLAASAEELLFRGYGFAWLGSALARLLHLVGRLVGVAPGRWRGAVAFGLVGAASAVIFGLAHASNPSAAWLSTLNTVLAGVWLTVIVVRTRALTWAIGAHLGWNHAQALVLGTPLSGLGPESLGEPLPSLLVVRLTGPEWWSGGAYGPEGSVVGTAVLAVAAIACAAIPRRPAAQSSLGLIPSELVPGSASGAP